ncbi:hypothetical protein GLW07_07650 [Bacillus hwajinpoensis]|uniref:DUF4145 domain-containing protein n=2 Tax=Guptibacillus hwajinpoensis TaxID=208199 RepID=A0A845EXH4_9BACL|nr:MULTISPECIES: hypothetical protein [Bacillaceae]MYL63228.1 hypothetical protein [Pseudalkalibacillus hwajinpoensis]
MMRKIQQTTINSVVKYGQTKLPKSANTECPECGNDAAFQLKFDYQINQAVFSTLSRCSVCKEAVLFILIKTSHGDRGEEVELFVHQTSFTREPLGRLTSSARLPDDLERVYRSAVNVHNMKDWTATAVMANRVLESITGSFLAENELGQPLSKQLETLAKQIDLEEPIVKLGQLLGKGSNLNDLLCLEKATSEETANLIIDLLDSLIEYLYILPQRIVHLQKQIEG